MQITPAIENLILSFGSLLVGTSSIVFFYWFPGPGYLLVLFLFALLTFVFSFRKKQVPWKSIFLMLISNYIAGFLCSIPSWGELLPIELILLLVYWGIIGLVGKLGVFLGHKYYAK
jgi:hypothetical protein